MRSMNEAVEKRLAEHGVGTAQFASLLSYLNSRRNAALRLKAMMLVGFAAIVTVGLSVAFLLGDLDKRDKGDLMKSSFMVGLALVVFAKPSIPQIEPDEVRDILGCPLARDLTMLLNRDLRGDIESVERLLVFLTAVAAFAALLFSKL